MRGAPDHAMLAAVLSDDLRATARMMEKSASSLPTDPQVATRMCSDVLIRLASALPAMGRLLGQDNEQLLDQLAAAKHRISELEAERIKAITMACDRCGYNGSLERVKTMEQLQAHTADLETRLLSAEAILEDLAAERDALLAQLARMKEATV